MANNTARYGFRWAYSLTGQCPSHQRMRVATGYQAAPGGTNVDLQIGDPVELLSSGYVGLAAAGTGVLYGVITGIHPYWDGSVKRYDTKLPGGTAYGTNLDRISMVYVMPVVDQVFLVNVADAVTATTEAGYLAFIGENCDHSFTASSAEKKAYPKLNISTHNTTATLQWRVVDYSLQPGLDFSGTNVDLLVTANVVRQAPYQTTGV